MVSLAGTASPQGAAGVPSIQATLAAAPGAAREDAFPGMRLVYLATFPDSRLEPALDRIAAGPLVTGDTLIAGTAPAWQAVPGGYQLGITRPAAFAGGIVAASLNALDVRFGVGTKFGLEATFVGPDGPHAPDATWAVVLGARTGGANEVGTIVRSAATMQVRGATARLNTPGFKAGTAVPETVPDISQDDYDRVFDPVSPQDFTLRLVVDRVAGRGQAALKIGNSVYTRTYEFAAFRAESGPDITAVGPAVAMIAGPDQRATVRVKEFRIYSP